MSRDRNGRPAGRRSFVLWIVLAAAAGLAAGCSTAGKNGTENHLDAAGKSAAGWIARHPQAASPDGASCRECHGNDLSGGISKVSCFSASRNGQLCHAGGPAFHPQTWLDCTSKSRSRSAWHGSAFQDCVAVNGFHCEACHTPPALGALGGKCVTCHFTIDAGRVPPGSSWSHGDVGGHAAFHDNDAIMAVCVNCHETHARFGQEPSCHNCHEPFPNFPGHPAGWLDKKTRGTNSWHATAYGNNTPPCADCHTLDVKCVNCHFTIGGAKVPAGSSYSHGQLGGHGDFLDDVPTRTVCQACHDANNANGNMPTPFCHNCHEPFPMYHPADWSARTRHGAAAKATPDATHGFASCQVCHGSNFLGTSSSAGVSCSQASFGGTACHGYVGSRPHPPGSTWEGDSAPTHRTTSTGNGTVCGGCHPTAGPGAFNCMLNNACHD